VPRCQTKTASGCYWARSAIALRAFCTCGSMLWLPGEGQEVGRGGIGFERRAAGAQVAKEPVPEKVAKAWAKEWAKEARR